MTKLNCSAKNCTYNKDNYCCKSGINVEGRGASNMDETCCGSFQSKGYGRSCCTNSDQHVHEKVDVHCEASTCRYNEELKCSASSIGISGPNASYCEETECASFAMK